jgi:hypothetical protein
MVIAGDCGGPPTWGRAMLDAWSHLSGNRTKVVRKPDTIRAELTGRETAEACDVVANGSSPVLALCRKLVDHGYDPATPLEAYRGDILCLGVRSIGEAAGLEINGAGNGFRRMREPDAASLVRQTVEEGMECLPMVGHPKNPIT